MLYKITKTIIGSEKIEKNIKIIHISDIHYSYLTTIKQLENLKCKILNSRPDYLCITGDTIDQVKSLQEIELIEALKTWLVQLASMPVIISLGNHDFNDNPKTSKLQYQFWSSIKQLHSNIHLLHNRVYKDQQIEFIGYTQPTSYYTNGSREDISIMINDFLHYPFLTKLQDEKYRIGLIHSPLYLTDKRLYSALSQYDMILAGHMHNGMVPPVIDELWNSHVGFIEPKKRLIAKNARGILQLPISHNRSTFINISSGITKIPGTAPLILHPLNKLYPSGIDEICLINAKENKIYEKKSHYTR